MASVGPTNARLSPPRHKPTPRVRHRGWLTLGVIALGVIALTLPSTDAASARYAGDQLMTAWNAGYTTHVYQDTSPRVRANGQWFRLRADSYLGGSALSARRGGSRISLTFTGTGVAVLGPKSPTRGKAKIYVDGHYVRTVNAYASRYRQRQPLYTATWSTSRTRTVTVEVVGTGSHPIFTVDAFVVRGPKRPKPVRGAPAPSPTPYAGVRAGPRSNADSDAGTHPDADADAASDRRHATPDGRAARRRRRRDRDAHADSAPDGHADADAAPDGHADTDSRADPDTRADIGADRAG